MRPHHSSRPRTMIVMAGNGIRTHQVRPTLSNIMGDPGAVCGATLRLLPLLPRSSYFFLLFFQDLLSMIHIEYSAEVLEIVFNRAQQALRRLCSLHRSLFISWTIYSALRVLGRSISNLGHYARGAASHLACCFSLSSKPVLSNLPFERTVVSKLLTCVSILGCKNHAYTLNS
ncbi:hypothetical protein CYLTODRAFT_239302 [Cylindrobasidium torrendii FP15055 ss-10]|uniref:Uncharacterized protein n=1 Tax=Cylindrobasidium torrendii FP15055 ss-10 TaxID=1314674 RepID=A0A0D7BSI0_9AGAR|nr:hypothetical protein CYLTODRAFT_239302 [Cylindrobasidium torrendii FP15055 ss-10]